MTSYLVGIVVGEPVREPVGNERPYELRDAAHVPLTRDVLQDASDLRRDAQQDPNTGGVVGVAWPSWAAWHGRESTPDVEYNGRQQSGHATRGNASRGLSQRPVYGGPVAYPRV